MLCRSCRLVMVAGTVTQMAPTVGGCLACSDTADDGTRQGSCPGGHALKTFIARMKERMAILFTFVTIQDAESQRSARPPWTWAMLRVVVPETVARVGHAAPQRAPPPPPPLPTPRSSRFFWFCM